MPPTFVVVDVLGPVERISATCASKHAMRRAIAAVHRAGATLDCGRRLQTPVDGSFDKAARSRIRQLRRATQ